MINQRILVIFMLFCFLVALRGRLSGICLPTYVLDIPGGYGKVPIGPNHLTSQHLVEDPQGQHHIYNDPT